MYASIYVCMYARMYVCINACVSLSHSRAPTAHSRSHSLHVPFVHFRSKKTIDTKNASHRLQDKTRKWWHRLPSSSGEHSDLSAASAASCPQGFAYIHDIDIHASMHADICIYACTHTCYRHIHACACIMHTSLSLAYAVSVSVCVCNSTQACTSTYVQAHVAYMHA